MDASQMDPKLKFAVGVRKGLPLNSVGMKYRIIKYKGEDVALFQNGSMAKFYIDMSRPKIKEEPPKEPDPQPESPTILAPTAADKVAVTTPERRHWFFVTPSRHKSRIAKVRLLNSNGWPVHQVTYAVLEDARVGFTASPEEVGKGLREYLWVYDMLRQLGRGRLEALLEARKVYFL